MTPRTFFLATAAVLPVALAVPALASMISAGDPEISALVSAPAPVAAAQSTPGNIILASSDYDDDDDDDGWFFGRDHDDDDDRYEHDECDDDDDDEGECAYGQAAPAPAAAGTATPPDNGLFAPGGAAVIQAN